MKTCIVRIFLLLAISQLFFSSIYAQYLFTITDLGTLGGKTSSASGISAWGQIVGTSTTSYGVNRAFGYWHGVMTDLGTLGGDYSSATAINNVGQVVGVAAISTGDLHAFLFQGSTMTDLGTLGGSSSQANAINDHGQIVGSSVLANGQTRAFLYSNGAMTNLGALYSGVDTSIATGINNAGTIIGNSDLPSSIDPQPGANAPFVIVGNQMTNINAKLGGAPDSYFLPTAINNSGQIVGGGYVSRFLDSDGAFILTGDVADFLVPFGSVGSHGSAYAINDSGIAVGFGSGNLVSPKAMIYYQGTPVPLNTLVNLSGTNFTHLDSATGINYFDQIVGNGTTKDGSSHAYLLTPIPAPSP